MGIYGVEDKIEFVHGNFFEVAKQLRGKVDAVFLSPPWGGAAYTDGKFNLGRIDIGGRDGRDLFAAARRITPNIAYFLPRNSDRQQLHSLDKRAEIVKNKLYNKCKSLTVYF